MRRLRRVLTVLLALALLLGLGGGWYGYTTVRASFPQTEGTIDVPGLDGEVRVLRDERGIPQVYASTDHDLMLAQGYVHAQDRFWEMDVRRHITAGRLSEMFGATQLDTDKFLRTLGWRRIAEQELTLLKPETVALVTAYAEGVNAWLADNGSGRELSLEYAVLGLQQPDYRPEPWSPADSVSWLKAMAWDLRGNIDDELARSIAAEAVGVDRAEELYPAYPFERNAPIVTRGGVRGYTVFDQQAPALLNRPGTMADIAALIARMPAYFDTKADGIGSNSWVVSGEHTDTGKPLLANDPHLSAMMPSIWTQVGLHCTTITSACSFDVAGWSFSGFPGVIIGHNQRVGWGFTNLGPDVADLVVEKVTGDTYEVDGEARPLTSVVETIRVACGEDVQWTSRSTEHGPLISDVSDSYASAAIEGGNAVALRWTALQPGTTADAVFTLDRASDWNSFRQAAREFTVPAQNLLYADVDGNIGYQAPGLIPIRRGYDGRWPVAGWDSRNGWSGYIPFAALPSAYNPPEGFIVTANQAVVHEKTYPYLLTKDWSYGSRSQRIREVLQARIASGEQVTTAFMQGLQMDARNEMASVLIPAMAAEWAQGEANPVFAQLLQWADDGYQMTTDAKGAALFASIWRHLLLDTFRDELPDAYAIEGGDRWFEVMRELLQDPDNRWWDDVTTTGKVETRADALASALSQATAELGFDPSSGEGGKTWGELHTLTLTNQTLGKSGIAPVERLFNRGPVAIPGSSAVVLAAGWSTDQGYQVDWLPSMRQVLDLADWDRSTWVNLTGQSGHAYSPHYVDQFDAWVAGRAFPWPFSQAAVRAAAAQVLVLRPAA